MTKKSIINLPSHYHLEHYQYLLEFVQKHYANLLLDQEKIFIAKFNSLSLAGRSLYVRLANRKTKFFKSMALNYPEITDMQAALDELITQGFAEWISPDSPVEYQELANSFTRTELNKIIRELDLQFSEKLNKTELIAKITANLSLASFIKTINNQVSLVTPLFLQENTMLQFLFFGSLHIDMTRFVMRDLGLVKLQNFNPSTFSPRFLNRQDAENCLQVDQAYLQLKTLQRSAHPNLIYEWFRNWHSQCAVLTTAAGPKFDKLVLRLAGYLEKNGYYEEALSCYSLTTQPPSLERQIRLLKKLGRIAAAKVLCQQLMKAAQNAKEIYFAKDFLAKLNLVKTRLSTTSYLANAKIIQLPKNNQLKPEQAVKNYLQQQGYQVLYTENYIWRGLFGLLFWDIVFDPNLKVLNNPLQISPSDLYAANFFQVREHAFSARTELLQHKAACLQQLHITYEKLFGINNPMITWHPDLWEGIKTYYAYISVNQLTAVLLEMAKSWRFNSSGFPDLFCWSKQGCEFIEVKSPNDQLSSQQLKWLEFFNAIQLRAQVIRISWGN